MDVSVFQIKGREIIDETMSFMGTENIGCVMNVPINCGQPTVSPTK